VLRVGVERRRVLFLGLVGGSGLSSVFDLLVCIFLKVRLSFYIFYSFFSSSLRRMVF
jgi:hypothetical protein